ncbi:MAG: lipopolysaccharide kinase InaA family protein [Cycloclasticus sp.]
MPYIAEKWRDILVFNGLDTHEKIWALKADWFEEPNYCRGGWSGVSRIELKLPLGGKVGMFLKRQEDHVTRSMSHPIKGIPTFFREFNVIQSFQDCNIPSLDLVFFNQWKEEGKKRACIMTEELAGFIPLSSDDYKIGGTLLPNEEQKVLLFTKIIELMHAMHRHNFQHGCLYPKHVFVKNLSTGGFDVRVIDLEKVKKVVFRERAVLRDLDTLLRRSNDWKDEDKLQFFKMYQKENELSQASEKLWEKLKNRKKQH